MWQVENSTEYFSFFFPQSEFSREKNIVWPNRWVQLAYARVNEGRRRKRRRRNHEEVIDWVTREQVNVFMCDVICCGNICGQNVWLIDIKLLQNRIERDCDYDDVTLQTPTQSNVIVTTACAQTNRKRKLRRPDSEKNRPKDKEYEIPFCLFWQEFNGKRARACRMRLVWLCRYVCVNIENWIRNVIVCWMLLTGEFSESYTRHRTLKWTESYVCCSLLKFNVDYVRSYAMSIWPATFAADANCVSVVRSVVVYTCRWTGLKIVLRHRIPWVGQI